MPTEITEKACTLCKKVQPVAEFVSSTGLGLANRCALCRSRGQKAHRKYVKKNLDTIHQYQADYVKERLRAPVEPGLMVCKRCLKTLPESEFPIGPNGTRFKNCDTCRKKIRDGQVFARARRTPEKADLHRKKCKDSNRAVRMQVLEHYGKICACCGESHIEFLGMDHVNGGGGVHRAEMHAGSIYRWLIRNGFPEGFRTLCFNCNFGRHVNGGICPHQKELNEQTVNSSE